MKTEVISKMRITETVLNEIITFIGGRPAESGGALFADANNVIQKFVPDRNAKVTGSTYTIDHEFINSVMKQLRQEGLFIAGIIHSHPHGASHLSGPDREYFKALLTNNLTRDYFFAPIVHSTVGGDFQLFPYILNSTGSTVTKGQLEIVYNDDVKVHTPQEQPDKSTVPGFLTKMDVLEIFLFKMLCFLCLSWMLLRLVFSLLQNMLNTFSHGTH